MNKSSISQKLGAVQFALWELHLYLDTHADDLTALELYNKYHHEYERLQEKYEEYCGPLFSTGRPGVSWLKDPWPWELGGNG